MSGSICREDFSAPLYEPCSSLYIHIPFCHSKCAYCDFYSTALLNGSVPEAYISACIAELSDIARRGLLRPLRTVYIGGGTPSLLSPEQLQALLDSIHSLIGFSSDVTPEITVEANPEDISDMFLSSMLNAGCTRLSVGVQSFSDSVLSLIGRNCRSKQIRKALSYIRWWRELHDGKPEFSLDLIAGLPGCTREEFCGGLAEAVSYRPDHISLYALTLEENTPLFRSVETGMVPYSDEENELQWLAGRALLKSFGYEQYEVSNFAQPGSQCRHNLVYWRLQGYAGIGAGASGTYICPAGGALRCTAPCSTADYINIWTSSSGKSLRNKYDLEVIDTDTLCFEAVMMGMRTREGISERLFEQRFGRSLRHYLGADTETGVFSCWEKQKYAASKPDGSDRRFFLTETGLLFLNRFLEEILYTTGS